MRTVDSDLTVRISSLCWENDDKHKKNIKKKKKEKKIV